MILIHRGCNGVILDTSPMVAGTCAIYALFQDKYQWLYVKTPYICTGCNWLIVGDDCMTTVVDKIYMEPAL